MNPDPPELVLGTIRIITYAGYVLLAGTFTFWAIVWPHGRRAARLVVLAVIGIALSAVAVLAGPVVQVLTGQTFADAVATPSGAALIVRFAAVASATFFLPDIVRGNVAGWRRLAPLLVVVVMAATMVAQSDAAEGAWRVAISVVAIVHLLAVATWLGALVAMVTLVVRRGRLQELDELTRRVAAVSSASVVVLAVTGTVQAVAQIGALHPPATSAYGVVLLIKVALLAGVLLVGWHGRAEAARVAFRASYATGNAELVRARRVHALVVVAGVELAIAAMILATTAVLVAYAPSP